MSRLVSAPFFSAHPVFRREEYAAAVGRRPGDRTVTAMLTQHQRAGNIRRIARGVFASVPKHADARTWSVDRFLAASRLRRDAVIACHSALELHGCAYSEGYEMQIIARGEPGTFEAVGFTCRFIKPPRGFTPRNATSTDGVMVIDRLGLWVDVTMIERTIVDLFDRCDLAGGSEELFNSLDLVARVDAAALVRYARARGNAAVHDLHGGDLSPVCTRARQRHGRRRAGFLAGARTGAAWCAEPRARRPPRTGAMPDTVCPWRQTGGGKGDPGLERHSPHRHRRTPLRGTVNGAALRFYPVSHSAWTMQAASWICFTVIFASERSRE